MKNDILSDTKCKHCGSDQLKRIGIEYIGNSTYWFIECNDCKQSFPLEVASENS